MKHSNTHRALYDAVTHIDPAMVDEATAQRRIRPHIIKIAAYAAAIALILYGAFIGYLLFDGHTYLAAAGVVNVYNYSSNGNNLISQPLEAGADINTPLEFAGTLNIVPGYPLTFSVDTEIPIMLQIAVSDGRFTDWHNDISSDGTFTKRESNGVLGTEFSIQNNRTIYWQSFGGAASGMPTTKTKNIFVDVILYSDSHIVGYCVIEILQYKDHHGDYCARLLASAFYPKVDGEFQDVAKEYVDKQILKAKVLK